VLDVVLVAAGVVVTGVVVAGVVIADVVLEEVGFDAVFLLEADFFPAEPPLLTTPPPEPALFSWLPPP
jgi:hypothetical protein